MMSEWSGVGVVESVTCCVLALVSLAVFRKELLKVKGALCAFWTPRSKRKSQDRKKNERQQSDKENVMSVQNSDQILERTTSPLKNIENVTKEVVLHTEITKKITKEEEGFRIKSATLLPDSVSFPSGNATSVAAETKKDHRESSQNFTNTKQVDPFPPFNELLQTLQGPPKPPRSPINSSTSSKVEEVTEDGKTVTKTATESKHEVIGNTEVSFMKKEQETVSTSSLHGDSTGKLKFDDMDLNELINATQKTIDSFQNGFKSDILDTTSSMQEIKKTETSFKTETKTVGEKLITESSLPFSDGAYPFALEDYVCSKKDTDSELPGFHMNTSESSCVTTEDPFSLTSITKKKKMFSSSSFYEEPGSLYPTVEEQVEMAKKIADSLADDTNRKSKGANMFYKRVKRSSKWIHEGPETGEDLVLFEESDNVEPPTPDINQVPFRPSKGPANLKLVLDQRHPMDLTALRSSGLAISEHNVVSPEVCHGIVKDLHSPIGKGAALFAKRKKKSEEWVVDEEKVRALVREQERKTSTPQPPFSQFSNYSRPDVRLVQSPWEAAMANPLGLPDAAFAPRVNPDTLADTVIRAADTKRRLFSPPPPETPDIYRAKPPRGWAVSNASNIEDLYPASSPSATTLGCAAESSSGKKMVFQNFNSLPRLWKGASR